MFLTPARIIADYVYVVIAELVRLIRCFCRSGRSELWSKNPLKVTRDFRRVPS
jgi:hypothetical protein